ncbi:hypothetical protein BDR26DRAFT_855955, partial [Obelidium mucronatum]
MASTTQREQTATRTILSMNAPQEQTSPAASTAITHAETSASSIPTQGVQTTANNTLERIGRWILRQAQDPYSSTEERYQNEDSSLPAIPSNRKWKRIHNLRLRYDAKPFFFDEILPEALEGKISNFIFTSRIKDVNTILCKQHSIKDCTNLWRNGITTVLIVATITVCALFLPPSFPVYFGWCLIVFTLWSFIQVWVTMEPRYEKDVRKLCQSWTQDDMHLHLAYISHRATTVRPETLLDTITSIFKPQMTEWLILIDENVAILPVDGFGRRCVDGGGWTVATVDSTATRGLPAYIPPWDATPAPQYIASNGGTVTES